MEFIVHLAAAEGGKYTLASEPSYDKNARLFIGEYPSLDATVDFLKWYRGLCDFLNCKLTIVYDNAKYPRIADALITFTAPVYRESQEWQEWKQE